MSKQILLLRLSYWAAALADFGVAILVLMPERMGFAEIEYPMGLASVIAFSWAVLLLAADRKPVERRWILLPTILVVALLTAVRILFAMIGTIKSSLAFPVFGIALILLMAYSYRSARPDEPHDP